MSRRIHCFVIISNLFLISPCITLNMLGPADALFKSFGSCEPPVEEISVKITQRKFNRSTNVLDIIVTTPMPLSDDIDMEIKSALKKDGGYKPGGLYLKEPLCQMLRKMLGDVFVAILKIAGKEDCPLPEGKYEILEFYLNNDLYNVPQIYGDYRTSCTFFKGDQTVACYNLYAEVVPKE